MSETETIEVQYETERSKVEGWRLHVLIQAGYPLPLAEKLAGATRTSIARSSWSRRDATTRSQRRSSSSPHYPPVAC